MTTSSDAPQGGGPPLVRLVALWVLMMRRRWAHESAALVSVVAFVAFVVLLVRALGAFDPRMYTVALIAASGFATSVSLTLPGVSLVEAARFRLIPMSRHRRFAAQLFFGPPIRLPAFVVLLIWLALTLGASSLGAGRVLVELVQGVALIAGVALLADRWASRDISRAAAAARFAFLAICWALLFLLVIPAARPMLAERLHRVDARGFDALLIGGRASPAWETLALTAYVLLLGGVAAAAWRGSAPGPLPAVGGDAGASRLARVARPLAPELRKETLLLLRMAGLRIPIALTLGVCLLSFAVGLPWLLLGLPLFWFGFYVNVFGGDLPQGGMVRYHIASVPLRRVLAWRHAAVLLLTGACALVAAAMAAGITGITAPLNGSPRWSYVGALALSLATLLFSAIPAGRVALRFPLPRKRTALVPVGEESGPAQLIFWTMVATGAAVGVPVISFMATSALLQAIVPGASVAASLTWAAVLAAALVAALYAVAMRMGWHVARGAHE